MAKVKYKLKEDYTAKGYDVVPMGMAKSPIEVTKAFEKGAIINTEEVKTGQSNLSVYVKYAKTIYNNVENFFENGAYVYIPLSKLELITNTSDTDNTGTENNNDNDTNEDDTSENSNKVLLKRGAIALVGLLGLYAILRITKIIK